MSIRDSAKREIRLARLFGGCSWSEAERELIEWIGIEGEDPNLLGQLAYCQFRKGSARDAERSCDRALATNAQEFLALRLLAAIAFERKDYEAAATWTRRALEVGPEPVPRCPRLIARVFRVLGVRRKWRRAARSVETFALNPNWENEQWIKRAEEFLDWHHQHMRPLRR